ncbi:MULTISPECIES: RpiB/LacA/LacB family sugar-phosphate isomerase [Streptomycetaceae]|uniref:Sugar-phosphate isomerase n=1 Tax=Streptantibioticus cattleyicolor (strain ATCC 35852 / DSM 46488 / JCM 4925 / NBRC 14057 / NRRL 8057) TaxID=1003195 RepID=F8K3J0_STREN|nr:MULTISPECIES: RpiB/LacA/LacB family sugar-phosphate isomerase [Streptomycetaceae]AEW96309.1 sugar-phosphate isomerase [Streptantibioticus cattleyicolor NRRL 8057 = DSM 46488]MYS60824.1 galactose isomerase [Streptomyces sp. SID5468]CCB76648.1 putative sugar-phosphate isomerase [Streptantibioticus cattleyicolor NRRL 8057 = DSM 46488]
MRIAVSSDMDEPVARVLVYELRKRGHDGDGHGALRGAGPEGAGRPDWAWSAESAAREVAEGRADSAVVCRWTGTGNKVPGVRAALCADARTAEGARRWNDANVLAQSLRLTSEPLLKEILDVWFAAVPDPDARTAANLAHLRELDGDA